ncbi:hypothetical protein JD292_02865 [Leucobacter sp. CSA2]|uniref:Protein ImuA n=1 Tax=Leucobacter edaphi TaxID=2796472 RepID=A0A934UVW8_9MICO|nr:hypothetical protein [Leucobacter edaphi]MBK0421024.1 hypothetical protein [Leucobacter edaphi]
MSQSATLHSLQQRISEMQPLRLGERGLPTLPGLRGLLPGGAIRQGASYSVNGSLQLSLSMLAAASTAGSWCGVIGFPGFGAEAAATLGIALDRCVLIPDPGSDALGFAGLLSEVLSVVLLASPRSIGSGETERISARLRDHGSALIVAGAWPRTESTLTVTSSRWSGLRRGGGLLADRALTVQSQDRRGTRTHTVAFADGRVADHADPAADPGSLPRMRLVASS